MKLSLPKRFGQRDPAWRGKPLGTSTTATIGSHGCLLTCVAAVCCYHGKDTDPARLNDELVKRKGFYRGSLLVFGAVSDIYPDIAVDWSRYIECPDAPAPLQAIYDALDEGYIPLLKVDASPAPGLQEHWVKAIGYDDATKELLVYDPYDNAEYWFTAKYGNPERNIYKIVVYKGPVIVKEEHYAIVYKGQVLATYERNPLDALEQLNRELEGARTNLAQEIQNGAALQAALAQQEKDNAEIMASLRRAERERDDAKAELREVRGWAKDILGIEPCTAEEFRAVKRGVESLRSEVSALLAENKALKGELALREALDDYDVLWRWGRYFVGKRRKGGEDA